MYYYGGNGFGFPWMFFGFGFFWLFILFFCLVFFGSRHWHHRRHHMGGWGDFYQDKQPMDYLKARYAKGEINKEEFEKIKKDIEEEHKA